MKPILALLLVLSFVSSTFSVDISMVVVMNRHGARAPLSSYYDSLKQWTGSSQQLTPYGHRMAYILGATYVKYYRSLLVPYSASTVNIESTNVERTVSTAKSFMQGVYNGSVTGTAYPSNITAPFYTQSTVDSVISKLNKSSTKYDTSAPVPPIHTNDEYNILSLNKFCAKTNTWGSENDDSVTLKNVYTTHMQDLVKYLKSKNITVSNMGDLYEFGDLAIANAFSGLPIPGGIDPTSQYYKDVKFAFEYTLAYWYTAQDIQVQMSSMNPFQNILNLMDKVVAGKSTLKYSMFSAHDTNLLPVLSILGVLNNTCLLENYIAQKANQALPYPTCVFPGFTANLAFELFGGTSPFVVLYYNGDRINICNGKSSCSLKSFRADIEKKTNWTYNNANFKVICAA